MCIMGKAGKNLYEAPKNNTSVKIVKNLKLDKVISNNRIKSSERNGTFPVVYFNINCSRGEKKQTNSFVLAISGRCKKND